MGGTNKRKMEKCSECGATLNRIESVLAGSDDALEKYYNKYIRRKNDSSEQSKG